MASESSYTAHRAFWLGIILVVPRDTVDTMGMIDMCCNRHYTYAS
ncbi:hypothetical protein BDK61_1134 [Haloarcula quadrata]|jgi:hypothetical protein|uniref:Uncharacterized protein n=1 Tax=Haloarcula quadrata TaxID=182779 RepID=A0A495R3P2_9EURY|nr:hypothetical protein BDK61_1134 [Haloarcula quadrata]